MKLKFGFLKDFEQFILRGNVMDMAVGVIIGAAFGQIINSMVKDIVMPVISIFTGRIDFSNKFIALNGKKYSTIAEAANAGASTINYGIFITIVIQFLITAFAIFLMVKAVNKLTDLKNKISPDDPTPIIEEPPLCPYCLMEIKKGATRCPYCTQVL